VLYGMSLEKIIPLFRPFRRMLKNNEAEKIETMVKIVNAKNVKGKTLRVGKNDKFYSNFWNNFSYSEVSEAVRDRQRIHASTFYLYANCCLVALGYLIFVVISISNPNITGFLSYNSILSLDLARILLAGFFTLFFWRKAKDEIEKSMAFQITAMYRHSKDLSAKLLEDVELREKVEKTGENKK
jgi:hypothetical protein